MFYMGLCSGRGIADIKYGETMAFIQHASTGLWVSYKTFETKKRGIGRVEEKKVILTDLICFTWGCVVGGVFKYGETMAFIQHASTGLWVSYKTFETKMRGISRVEEKKVILTDWYCLHGVV